MRLYEVIVRLPNTYNTATLQMQANNDYECKQLAEAQYGRGNIVSHRDITPT
jgi:hypothetical protein